jgi:hypothetical protein
MDTASGRCKKTPDFGRSAAFRRLRMMQRRGIETANTQITPIMKSCLTGLLLVVAASVPAAPLMITVPALPASTTRAALPMSVAIDLSANPDGLGAPSQRDRLQLAAVDGSNRVRPIPVQFEPDTPGARRGTLRWLMPPGEPAARQWRLESRATPLEPVMQAQPDSATGQWKVREADQPVLQYNYQTNFPGELLAKIRPDNLKYARPRSDYIHPLYGFHGEELTKDWSLDHPHHRGIYWAWPEVDYRGERGDLHALQRVFTRPTGRCLAQSGPVFARLEAENLWRWEDREAIVREQAVIRVWRADAGSRFIDLEFCFTALQDDVALARRETRLYGGLNVRLASVQDQRIVLYTDPAGTASPRSWAHLSGIFAGGKDMTSLAIFQKPANPDYPGDWIQYPEINWFQPTFPAAGTRYVLRKEQQLVLQYRLWIRDGPITDPDLAALWTGYAQPPKISVAF